MPVEDAAAVSRCVAEMEHGLARPRAGFPPSLRRLREIHGVPLAQPRGCGKAPGEFRRRQVWIGGMRPGNAFFVPPPANQLATRLDRVEHFLHDEPQPTPPLLKAALAHVQFDAIHPFLDGGGRAGWLLVLLQLVADGLLREPLLFPGLFFNAHRGAVLRPAERDAAARRPD